MHCKRRKQSARKTRSEFFCSCSQPHCKFTLCFFLGLKSLLVVKNCFHLCLWVCVLLPGWTLCVYLYKRTSVELGQFSLPAWLITSLCLVSILGREPPARQTFFATLTDTSVGKGEWGGGVERNRWSKGWGWGRSCMRLMSWWWLAVLRIGWWSSEPWMMRWRWSK